LGCGFAATQASPSKKNHCHSERNMVKRRI
jgi:hypothetical protein